MNKTYSKIAFVLRVLIILNTITISAQAFSANYTYDLNGNRLTAKVIYLTTSLKSGTLPLDSVIGKDNPSPGDISKLPQDGWSKASMDSSSDVKITIYPNPTHGDLLVKIEGIYGDQLNDVNNAIQVWDLQGKKILTIQPLNLYNSIEMSTMPNGIYAIVISINGKAKNYRIVKN